RSAPPSSPAPRTSITPVAGAIPEVRGVFTYAQIAAEACAAAGLTLAWHLASPVMQGDYTANARVLDILTDLARPWTSAEPTRADVYVDGTTVIRKQREPAAGGRVTHPLAQLRPASVRFAT